MKLKKIILSSIGIILLSYGLTLLSLSSHGGILYFIWHKFYYIPFNAMFIYYLITVSLLWYIFSNADFGRTSTIRKITVVISVLLIGIILTGTSLFVPIKVNSANFSHTRGFPVKFYLPTEDYRIPESLTGVTVKNGKYVFEFPMYYIFPEPQEYAYRIFKIPFLIDILFYSVIILLLQLFVAYVKRKMLRGFYVANNSGHS